MKFGFNFGLLGAVSGSAAVQYLVNYQSDDNFVYNLDESDKAILDNQGTSSTVNNALLSSGRAILLGATNDLPFTVGSKWITWFDFADNEFHKQTGDKTFNDIKINNILISTDEPSSATITAFNSNPQLVAKLAMSGTGTISEVDLELESGDEWYACSEPSLATIYDARGSNTETITNYAGTIRTNADYEEEGLQDKGLVLDGNGVPTAYKEDELHFYQKRYPEVNTQYSFGGAFVIEVGCYLESNIENAGGGNRNAPFGTEYRTNAKRVFSHIGDDGVVRLSLVSSGDADYLSVATEAADAPQDTLQLIQYRYDGTPSAGHIKIYVNGSEKTLTTDTEVGNFTNVEIDELHLGIARWIDIASYTTMKGHFNHFEVITDADEVANYNAVTAYNEWNS